MTNDVSFVEAVPVSRIFLHINNPRFDPSLAIKSEKAAIEQLCLEEQIVPLASDIVEHGLNPLERFALVPIQPDSGKADRTSYTVAEGNRRICALKLLIDPELSPASIKREIIALSSKWEPIVTVSAAIFQSYDKQIKHWMMRIHDGSQGGRGRKPWSPDRKTQTWGGQKNRLAMAFLDYAENKKFISKEERKGKLSVAERFLSNALFREAIGLDKSDPEVFRCTRPVEEFDVLVSQFIDDMKTGRTVNTRKNSSEITDYSRALVLKSLVSNTRVPSEPLSATAPAKQQTAKSTPTPRRPASAQFIGHEIEIKDALGRLNNEKLSRLYYSITQVDLKTHTPLICVGVWSFLETLTACMGRTDASFNSFLSKLKLSGYGLGTGRNLSSITAIIERIAEYGNTTKHHPVAATFNGDQINNDMKVLKPFILKFIEEAIIASG